jgi:hypothetical protein
MDASCQPLVGYDDPRREAVKLIGQANAESVIQWARVAMAVAIQCPSAAGPPLKRGYKDLDLVGTVDAHGRILDVFIDRIVMCHSLDVSEPLHLHKHTLSPEDLLLTSLSGDRDQRERPQGCRSDPGGLRCRRGAHRLDTRVRLGLVAYSNTGAHGRQLLQRRVRELQPKRRPRESDQRCRTEDYRRAERTRVALHARVGDRMTWYQTPKRRNR